MDIPGAHQHASHPGTGLEEIQRQRGHIISGLVTKSPELVQKGEDLPLKAAVGVAARAPLGVVHPVGPAVHGHILQRPELAGQEALGQGAVRPEQDLPFLHDGAELVLRQPPHQRVGHLVEDYAVGRHMLQALDPVVAHADHADLARLFQLIKGPEGLLHRDVLIGPVDLEDVDIIGLQPPEGRLAGGDDIVMMKVVGVDLGGQHRLLPAALQCLAQHQFRRAVTVFLRRIKEVDAPFQGLVHRLDGRIPVAAAPHRRPGKGPGAQGQAGDLCRSVV